MSIGVYGITHLLIPIENVNYRKLSQTTLSSTIIDSDDQIILLTHSSWIGRTFIHSTPDSLYTNLLNDDWKKRGKENVVIIIYHEEKRREEKKKEDNYLEVREKDVEAPGLK